MNGEVTIVRSALLWGVIASAPAAAIAYAVRGPHGAFSTLIAAAIVLANAGLAAGFTALAARKHTFASGLVALPSFAVRMAAILVALALLKSASFIDKPTFALAFAVSVSAVLFLEARSFKRTPWLARTFSPKDEVKS